MLTKIRGASVPHKRTPRQHTRLQELWRSTTHRSTGTRGNVWESGRRQVFVQDHMFTSNTTSTHSTAR